MTEPHEIETFDDLSGKYSTWIIKYCSPSYDSPLFLVWYTDTDENSTDRLLTYKSGEIFAIKSLTNLKTSIASSVDNLIEFENFSSWLNNFNNLEVKENCTYDLISITNEIDKNNLDISTIEDFTNFINLYGDFINQDERNAHLQVYADNELIKETWDYYYDYIFWPRFNDKEKFEVRKKFFAEQVAMFNAKYPGAFTVDMKDQYYNMREKVEPVMHIVELANKAMQELGITPIVKPIRGGTDGSRLSYMGLPCPNIFAGGMNFHGRYEYVSLEVMELATKVIVKIAENLAKG